MSVYLIEASHDLNIQTASNTKAFMAECKADDLRRAC